MARSEQVSPRERTDLRRCTRLFRRKCWCALARATAPVVMPGIVSIAQTSLWVLPPFLLSLLTGSAFAQNTETKNVGADASSEKEAPPDSTVNDAHSPPEEAPPTQETGEASLEGQETAPEDGSPPSEQSTAVQEDPAPALEGGQPEAPPSAEPNAAESSPADTQLVTRPSEQPSKNESERPLYLAPPKKILIAENPLSDEVDPREEMPGDVVARPLTLPRGTFAFAFGLGSVFSQDQSKTANSPNFGLGITDAVELGLRAPLRYDQGIEAWSPLEPTPYLAVTWEQREAIEYGTEVSVVIPTLGETDTQLNVAVPVLLRPHPQWRLDAAVEGQIGFEDETQVSIRVPVLARAQLLPALFVGLGAAADLGVTAGRDSGADLRALIGTTYQSRGRAHVELTGEFFIENMGGGPGDQLSDGTGFLLQVGFFPQLY